MACSFIVLIDFKFVLVLHFYAFCLIIMMFHNKTKLIYHFDANDPHELMGH